MKRVMLCGAMLLLVGCAPTRYKPLCPPLVHYTAKEEKQAADELHELPAMMRDYGNERREVCNVSLPEK